MAKRPTPSRTLACPHLRGVRIVCASLVSVVEWGGLDWSFRSIDSIDFWWRLARSRSLASPEKFDHRASCDVGGDCSNPNHQGHDREPRRAAVTVACAISPDHTPHDMTTNSNPNPWRVLFDMIGSPGALQSHSRLAERPSYPVHIPSHRQEKPERGGWRWRAGCRSGPGILAWPSTSGRRIEVTEKKPGACQ